MLGVWGSRSLSMPESGFAAIVLAAGASVRLGRAKQLIQLNGESLLRRAARMAVEAGCAPVFVVLGYRAEEMQPELQGLPASPLVNENWPSGMGSSLRCGMAAVAQLHPQPSGVLALVCDQPALSTVHLRTLLARQTAADFPITASFYSGKAGVPAVFSPELFPELLSAAADRGARDLIRRHQDQAQTISWPEGELDLDAAADLKRAGLQ